MPTTKFYIQKEKDGSVNKQYEAFLKAFKDAKPGRWVITLERYIKRRSNPQNSYYWAVVVPCVCDGLVDMGFNPSELNKEVVHEMLKNKFLTVDISNESGEFVNITRSTSTINVMQFMEFIAEIQQWAAAFLGINIPDPDTQGELNFK